MLLNYDIMGAYMFISVVDSVSSHSTLIISALPTTNSCVVIVLGAIRDLFIMKATPAVALGDVGSSDVSISIFFPKAAWILLACSWSRCISWRARITILNLFSVWLTMDHFWRKVMPLAGAIKPFMLRVAMLIFVHSSFFSLSGVSTEFAPGEGEC